ncbi:MAG: alanine--tRNA ligase, partial [Candidatus Cloacimonadaceae bacterium]
ELWNLVFIQYKREADQTLIPLKNRYVDTGAGLERIVQVLQNKDTNYETDLFMPIILKIAEFAGKAYTPESGMSHRVIADHIRCLCFALADGGFPSNEGRGYVLRRILRRAARHGRLLGFAEPFLFNLVDTVIQIMGHHFGELKGKEAYIKMVIKAEEERFNKTLDIGLAKFAELRALAAGKLISGLDAFMLYDTYGFPLDLTMILAEEQGLKIDHEGFDQEMQAQRARARKASKFGAESINEDWIELRELSPSQFVGYETSQVRTVIQRYSINDEQVVAVQLQQTPFYAESGGQVADTGRIYNDEFELKVHDVKKIDDAIIHYGTIFRGLVSAAEITAEIDEPRRQDIARNHTATHLLHQSLREVLGEHVQQKGSLVHPEYLRFDFTHFKGLSPDQRERVESKVNQAIMANMTVNIAIQDIATAKAEGATALFGEKYADEVRVISIDHLSKELCGGSHVSATGQIGIFKIISEGSVAAGIRRIEALTGTSALSYVRDLQNSWARVAELLASPVHLVEKKLEAQAQHIHDLQGQVTDLQAEKSLGQIDGMLQGAIEFPGFSLIIQELPEGSDLKAFSESLKAKLSNQIAIILCKKGDKLSMLTVVGTELLAKYHAGKIVSGIAALLGGKGGGRADSAMAGGNHSGDLQPFIDKIRDFIKSL